MYQCCSTFTEKYRCEKCSYGTNIKVKLKEHQVGDCGDVAPLGEINCELCPFQTASELQLLCHSCPELERAFNTVDDEWLRCGDCDLKRQLGTTDDPIIVSVSKPKVRTCGSKSITFCIYCSKDVLNFRRHLERNHKEFTNVQQFLACPKKSKERQRILALLRNEGNYQKFLQGKGKPMRQSANPDTDIFAPCVYCKGIYKKKNLARHSRTCFNIARKLDNIKATSASQNLLASSLNTSQAFRRLCQQGEIFSVMNADEVAFIAKADPLICLYGEQFLRKNKKHTLMLCSNKMRTLGRFLQEYRRVQNREKTSLVEVLDPGNMTRVRQCTRNLAGFNPTTKAFGSPSLALHLGSLLRQLADLLISLILTQNPDVILVNPELKLAKVREFRELLDEGWKSDEDSTKAKDLKPSIATFTEDILKLKAFLLERARNAAGVVLQDLEHYLALLKAVLTLTLLYNKTRVDSYYIKLVNYLNETKDYSYITGIARILRENYKSLRCAGRQEVLFPQFLRELIDVMLVTRQRTGLIPDSNPFLFALPNQEVWAIGDEALRESVARSGIKTGKEIVSNRYRNQIALVMQISDLTPENMVKLLSYSPFKCTQTPIKVSGEVFKIAQLSRIVMLVEKKRSKAIELQPELKAIDSELSEDEVSALINCSVKSTIVSMPAVLKEKKTEGESSKKREKKRWRWSPEQAELVKDHFQRHIKYKIAPKKSECQAFLVSYASLFAGSDWVRIKTYVYNTYREK